MNWSALIGILEPTIVDVISWLLTQIHVPINKTALTNHVPAVAVTSTSLWEGFKLVIANIDAIISNPTYVQAALSYLRMLEVLLGMTPPTPLAAAVKPLMEK